MEILRVYTDGACSGNPGPGGYAAVILNTNGVMSTLSGGEKSTTNNRMEMLATIESLKVLRTMLKQPDYLIEYYVDSQYVLKGITEWMEGWKKKNWKGTTGPVKNRELWEQIDELKNGLNIKWIWVKGHAGDEYNEIVDKLAVAEIEKLRAK
jgi:ribonuclease HI